MIKNECKAERRTQRQLTISVVAGVETNALNTAYKIPTAL